MELNESADLSNGAQALRRTNFAGFQGSHLRVITVPSIMLDIWICIIYSPRGDDGIVPRQPTLPVETRIRSRRRAAGLSQQGLATLGGYDSSKARTVVAELDL
jgi:hypothetical protein